MSVFLVSSAVPVGQNQPDSYDVSMDGGTAVNSVAATNPDGSKQLKYQLPDTLANGAHTVTVVAKNIWGSAPPSSPFTFTKSPPGTAININIVVA